MKLLLTTAKDQVKLSERPNAGRVLCLFYVKPDLCEGQLHCLAFRAVCIVLQLVTLLWLPQLWTQLNNQYITARGANSF